MKIEKDRVVRFHYAVAEQGQAEQQHAAAKARGETGMQEACGGGGNAARCQVECRHSGFTGVRWT